VQSGLIETDPLINQQTWDVFARASQDTSGPMTRTVKDASILLQVKAGPDEQAIGPATFPLSDIRPSLNYVNYMNTGTLQEERLGVLRKVFDSHAKVNES